MSQEIQLYSKLQPADVVSMGLTLGKSGCFGMDKAEQGVTALMVCMCDNISLATFMRTYHVMPGGKFIKKAMAAYAEFRAKGGKIKWLKTGDEVFDKSKEDERKATGLVSFEGNELEYSYSIADAKREKVWKVGGRYDTRPGQVLRARVITNALGMLAPEIFAGEDDGDYIAPATELDLTKSTATVQVAPLAAGGVAAAASTSAPDNEKELAEAGLAPEKKEEIKKPAEVVSTVKSPPNVGFEKLDTTIAAAVVNHIGPENIDASLAWMAANGWVNSEKNILSLPIAKANMVLRTPRERVLGNFKITPAATV